MNINLIKEKIKERDSETLKSKKIIDEASFLSNAHLDNAKYSAKVANNLLNAFTLASDIKKEFKIVMILASEDETNKSNRDIILLSDGESFSYMIKDEHYDEYKLMNDGQTEKELGLELYSSAVKAMMKQQNSLIPQDANIRPLIESLTELATEGLDKRNAMRKASEN